MGETQPRVDTAVLSPHHFPLFSWRSARNDFAAIALRSDAEVYPFRWKQKNFTTEDTEKIEDTEKRRLYAISLCPSFLCGENEFQPNSIHYRKCAFVDGGKRTRYYHVGVGIGWKPGVFALAAGLVRFTCRKAAAIENLQRISYRMSNKISC
ncbi:MAG: hypothetical protein OXN88_12960 [Chloroflexota bacterium]|nr:hypothetical protein [Chloroflexota bacterium]